MPADERRPRRRRPAPVTILAGLQVVTALMLGVVAVALLVDPAQTLAVVGDVTVAAEVAGVEAAGVAGVLAVMAALELVAAIALLRLSQLGWTLTMLVTGASLASGIVTWWSTGEVLTVSMLLGVATVLYLNQHQVRAAFDLAHGRPADLQEDRG
jgi:hypothetical protein